jgi:hypothetical protein
MSELNSDGRYPDRAFRTAPTRVNSGNSQPGQGFDQRAQSSGTNAGAAQPGGKGKDEVHRAGEKAHTWQLPSWTTPYAYDWSPSRTTVLDGAWWPHSTNAVTEALTESAVRSHTC